MCNVSKALLPSHCALGCPHCSEANKTLATGILWDWHIFTWFFIWGNYNNSALAAENWGWFIEFTPAFIGSGMLVGLNTSISFLMGSVIAWGIIGPALVHNGAAFGSPLGSVIAPDDPHWDSYVSFASLSSKFSSKDHPSPRYWLLWPGVLLMIVVSFTELALQYKVIYFMGRAVVRGSAQGINAALKTMGKSSKTLEKRAQMGDDDDLIKDTAEDHQLVKAWMWAPLLILSIIALSLIHI